MRAHVKGRDFAAAAAHFAAASAASSAAPAAAPAAPAGAESNHHHANEFDTGDDDVDEFDTGDDDVGVVLNVLDMGGLGNVRRV